MKFYSGQHGRMLIDGQVAAKVTNWSINSSMSPLDTTTLEDTDSTYINGLRNTTGSCRLYYYDYQDGGKRKNDAKDLVTHLIKARDGQGDGKTTPPENVQLSLQVVVDANTTRQIVVDALLTSASMAMGVGEVLSADVSFQVNGAPTQVEL